MSNEDIVNLQQRVLRGEDVTDDELKHALETLAKSRANASSAVAAAKTPTVTLSTTSALGQALAAARAKTAQ